MIPDSRVTWGLKEDFGDIVTLELGFKVVSKSSSDGDVEHLLFWGNFMFSLTKQERVIAVKTAMNMVRLVSHGAGLVLPFIY